MSRQAGIWQRGTAIAEPVTGPRADNEDLKAGSLPMDRRGGWTSLRKWVRLERYESCAERSALIACPVFSPSRRRTGAGCL
jgi:hypothetical protein